MSTTGFFDVGLRFSFFICRYTLHFRVTKNGQVLNNNISVLSAQIDRIFFLKLKIVSEIH